MNLVSLRRLEPYIDMFRAKYRAGVEAAITLGGAAGNNDPARWRREAESPRPVAVGATPYRGTGGHVAQGTRRPELPRTFQGFAPKGAPRGPQGYTPHRDTGVHPAAVPRTPPMPQAAPGDTTTGKRSRLLPMRPIRSYPTTMPIVDTSNSRESSATQVGIHAPGKAGEAEGSQ